MNVLVYLLVITTNGYSGDFAQVQPTLFSVQAECDALAWKISRTRHEYPKAECYPAHVYLQGQQPQATLSPPPSTVNSTKGR